MLDPDEAFQIQTISRRNITDEINSVLDADHQLEPTDDRLTRDLCRGWANAIAVQDYPDDEESAAFELRLAISTAIEIGLIDYINEEFRDLVSDND